ncbi:MAG: biopolymer transporter ExbD [Deltaproteobacteria bacterium]|jgi:biopolymer transport protein ExbD|nr:biopolymer transporter ExbD [Deltaproteobacteria bacterium]
MEDKSIDTLNMIPLIDIMLVLLTIVLTTSSFIATGRIPVQLPQASAGDVDDSQLETIEIDAQGQLYHGDETVTIERLREKLSPLQRSQAFLLRADKTVQLQRFVDVADLLKQLQFTKVAVQTDTSVRGS